ncbi:SIS domain-containing protein [Erysipelothrix urinaevulpis]|uniref:SIS domain-containing protein n=1 Tax=Erysipelothrix urinaevulpis TaxID=2683717 RepID=UPI001358A47B|nr:SIS domain-containing protein [Erysipelothrix urinaevulpis]
MILGKKVEKWKELNGYNTANEIYQQPDTWEKTKTLIENQKYSLSTYIEPFKKEGTIIFTGAGTSEFVGSTLVPLLQEKYFDRVLSIPTTDIVANPKRHIHEEGKILLVSFGRSGNSPESIASVDLANQINPDVSHLIITCNHEGKLALREGENYYSIKLPPETNDQSFAMTSSYTNMVLAAYLAFNLDTIESEKELVDEAIEKANDIRLNDYKKIEAIIDSFDFNRIVYIGDDELEALAHEASLKMLELTAGETVVAYNTPLGFRHGPKSILNSETLMVVLMSNNHYTRKYQIDLIKEVASQRKGNKIMVVDKLHDHDLESLVDIYLPVTYNSSKDLSVLASSLYVQMMSLFKALQVGKGPDNPWPSGEVNRVVQGVILYDFEEEAS